MQLQRTQNLHLHVGRVSQNDFVPVLITGMSCILDIFSLILHFIVFLIILIFLITSAWKHIAEDADTLYLCKMLKLYFWSYSPSILFISQS